MSLLTSSWALLHQFLFVCVLEDALKDLPDTRLLIPLTSDSRLLPEKITLGYTPTKEESKERGKPVDPKLRNRKVLGQLCSRQREQFIQIEAGRPEDSERCL